MQQTQQVSYLNCDSGEHIAYHHLAGETPGILFCIGFHSDMHGDKALALEAYCRQRGQQFTRFDYYGHGQSSGDINKGTIGQWRQNTLTILDKVTEGAQIIVGSSMGGWMMLLAALARRERVAALVGIAVSPDMTDDLQTNRLSSKQQRSLEKNGWCDLPNEYNDKQPYRIHKHFLDEAKQHLILDKEIAINVPVRLFHGLADIDVSWRRSQGVIEQLQGDDVELTLVKSGDHRFSSPENLASLFTTLNALLQK